MNGLFRVKIREDTLYTGKQGLFFCKHRNRVSCSEKRARPACLSTRRWRDAFCLQGRIPDPLLGAPKPLGEATKKYFQNLAPLLAKRPFPPWWWRKGQALSIFAGKGVNIVEFISFGERIQHQFDAYCKKVLRFAARDIYKRLARQSERELSLSDFPVNGASIAAVVDDYFEEERQFEALGFSVTIKSELLAEALQSLPERQREIIMRYYFFGMSDRAIGETSDTQRSTISYQRNMALKKLKEILEGLEHE